MSKTTDKKISKEKLEDASVKENAVAEEAESECEATAQTIVDENSPGAAVRLMDAPDGAADSTIAETLEVKSAECDQLKDQLLRVRADFDNYRKRLLREMEQLRQSASLRLIQNLLPALDNLERALAHAKAEDGFVEGVSMVYRQFQEILGAEGLEPIPALGEPFDPNVHDALATMPSETVESGRILEEYERGYRLRDAVVRPARVIVSSGVPPNDETSVSSESERGPAESTETIREDTSSNT